MQSLKSQITWCRRAQYGLAITLGVVALLFYFAGYRPQTAAIREILAQITDTQRQLEISQTKAQTLPKVALELTRLRAQLADFKKLWTNAEIGEFMQEITEVSKQSDLKKLEVNFASGPRRSEQFTELPVSMRFEGDFLSVFNFLRQAEDMPWLTRVSNLSIRGADLKSGTVQVEMSMNLYFSEGG